MILYEYPFNERIRTYLRLEQMLHRLSEMMGRDSPYDHHFALVTLFEIMDVAARADLKADILKDLDKQKGLMNSYRGNPAIVEAALDQVIARLDATYTALNEQHGKAGSELLSNEWLMSVRSRTVIPGGTCSFDLPAYHAWQHRPADERKHQLAEWIKALMPMAKAIALLLQMLRDAGTPQRVLAKNGQFQQQLPQARSFQLVRVVMDARLGLVPEISGNRLMVSVRMTRHDVNTKMEPFREDTAFELTLCAGG